MTGSLIDASTSLIAAQTHDVIRLAMGSPAIEAMPIEVFSSLLAEVLAERPAPFDYVPTEGEIGLRTELIEFLELNGEAVAEDELMITSGGMQGLDLAFKIFVGPGDLVAVESPTYTNGAATIASYEGEILEVPIDAEGLDVPALAALVKKRGLAPKVIYTIPTFQNPSGTTLSLSRRRQLIDLSEQWGAIIVEDDPYSLLRFAGDALPSLRELGNGRVRVIAVHTFSKILAPGLRVGWIIAEPEVIALMVKARQAMDTCTNNLQQRLVSRFLAEGHMEGHLRSLRAEYRTRKESMQCCLVEEFSEFDVSWTDPQGGFFLWLTLPKGVDTSRLFVDAIQSGVAFVPGSAFSVSGSFNNALRLAFSAESPSRAREGVRRLSNVLAPILRDQ
jgi:2-aminoadipate transaminase